MQSQLITTRPVTLDDRLLLYRIFVSSREEEFALLGWPAEKVEELLRQQFELQTKGYSAMFPHAEHLIILFNGEPVGRVMIDYGESEIRMVDIAIFSQFRRKGIGRRIVERLQETAEKTGKPLRHHVYRGELNAIRFYFALGYRVAVQEEAGYQMEWTPTTALSHSVQTVRSCASND
jgi:ribosomal protein S18 acetylase RimI-like enzyme